MEPADPAGIHQSREHRSHVEKSDAVMQQTDGTDKRR
jgi:hypothetical protein